MTELDIERLAREAGMREYKYDSGEIEWMGSSGSDGLSTSDLQRFAALVLEHSETTK
jgi:hypothetical protein